jgi:hypothetical protein
LRVSDAGRAANTSAVTFAEARACSSTCSMEASLKKRVIPERKLPLAAWAEVGGRNIAVWTLIRSPTCVVEIAIMYPRCSYCGICLASVIELRRRYDFRLFGVNWDRRKASLMDCYAAIVSKPAAEPLRTYSWPAVFFAHTANSSNRSGPIIWMGKMQGHWPALAPVPVDTNQTCEPTHLALDARRPNGNNRREVPIGRIPAQRGRPHAEALLLPFFRTGSPRLQFQVVSRILFSLVPPPPPR